MLCTTKTITKHLIKLGRMLALQPHPPLLALSYNYIVSVH